MLNIMFFERHHTDNDLVNTISELLMDKTITLTERDLLLHAKQDLQNRKEASNVMHGLKNNLTPLAIRQELSPKLLSFYANLDRYYSRPGKWSYLNLFKR